jgi:hypothetical protein
MILKEGKVASQVAEESSYHQHLPNEMYCIPFQSIVMSVLKVIML